MAKAALFSNPMILDNIDKSTSLMDLSMGLDKQIDLIKATQNCVLHEKLVLLTKKKVCFCCSGKLKKAVSVI